MARYKYDSEGKLLAYDEATGEWKREKRSKGKFDFSKPMQYVPDIREFVANASDKPQLISSRSQLSRYERSNNIRQVGNDLKGYHVRAAKRRHAADQALIARERRRVRTDVSWSNVPDGRVLDRRA